MTSFASDLAEYKRICNEVDPACDQIYVDRQRVNYLRLFEAFPVPRPAEVETAVHALELPGRTLHLHVHRRRDAVAAEEPCLLYAHGGGFIAGGLEASESIAMDLAAALRITVVNFSYRLAPEHPFPAALEDCHAILCEVAAHPARYGARADRLLFGGESCGGNFAAALPLYARDRGGPRLFAQVPINPVFDVHRWAYREVTDCDPAFCDEMVNYTGKYLHAGDGGLAPYASPLRAGDLSGLGPFFIWAAEIDPLAKESEAFAARLDAAGVACHLHIERGVVHGSLRARARYEFAAAGFRRLCGGIRALLDGEIRLNAPGPRLEAGV
ncbi:MAG TPA: alpha/beta hydrolase [Kofleriaceae bacterium]|nr:alpha/beta hydrolase [Kofleriaceae bacterium]